MKQIKLIFILMLTISCKAQSPIVDIANKGGNRQTGTYYKDVNNLLNPFEGTYIYTNGTTSFKVVLVKKVQQYNGRYYEDLIIGEYQYIENGVDKVNTLSEINNVYNNQRRHNINGNSILGNNAREWKCPLCSPNQKMLSASITDASSGRSAVLSIRKTMVGNQEAINIKISQIAMEINFGGNPPALPFSLPFGEYTLLKL